jgi:hypothetical protein
VPKGNLWICRYQPFEIEKKVVVDKDQHLYGICF